MESILTTIKQMLGPSAEHTYYDPEIITHINTVLFDLTQLGVGPAEGFFIEDDTSVWNDFLPEPGKLEAVKTYIYQRVKLIFDPPTNASVIASMERQIEKFEWRINIGAESIDINE